MSLVITDTETEENCSTTHTGDDNKRETQFSGLGATPSLEADEEMSKGPIVINSDGSLSRIKNWGEMSDSEKAKTKKLILARNARRRKQLEEEEKKEKEANNGQ